MGSNQQIRRKKKFKKIIDVKLLTTKIIVPLWHGWLSVSSRHKYNKLRVINLLGMIISSSIVVQLHCYREHSSH
jgi:hypothetical protein